MLTLRERLIQMNDACDVVDDGTPQRKDIINQIRSSLLMNIQYIDGKRELTSEEQIGIEQDIYVLSKKIDYLVAHVFTGTNIELNELLKEENIPDTERNPNQ